MKLRQLPAFLLLLSLLLSLSGCWDADPDLSDSEDFWGDDANTQDTPAQEDSALQIASFTLPVLSGQTLDPVTCIDGVQQTVGSLLYEGLFTLDGTFQPQNTLCESYAYDAETLTYTFTLRSGVIFSDGSSLTANDVLSTYRRAAESDRYAARFSDVVSMRATSPLALTITLSRGSVSFPSLLDIPIVKAGTEGNLVPLGTGPYLYVSDAGTPALTANTAWWKGSALPLSRISLAPVKDNETAVSLFNSYSIHFLLVDPTGVSPIPANGHFELTDLPSPVMQYLGFNARRTLLSEAAVRTAMSGRIDRTVLVSSFLSGHGHAAQFPVSPVSSAYPGELTFTTGQTEYETVLAEHGVSADRPRTLTLLVNAENTFRCAVAESICTQLSTDALTVTPRVLPWADYLAALESGSFDLYLGEVRLTADWDTTAFFAPGGALNYGGYEGEALSALSAASLAGTDSGASYRFFRAFAAEMPFAPLLFKTQAVLTPTALISGLSATASTPMNGIEHWTFHLSGAD